MPAAKQPTNPFYVLLVIVGIVFLITVCGYAVMSVRGSDFPAQPDSDKHPFLVFMEEHGFTTLMVELVVLAVATTAAIATDEYWSRKTASVASVQEDAEPRDQEARTEQDS